MEFYKKKSIRFYIMLLVSIPNGMEFYGFIVDIRAGWLKFQFPTGWNSTSEFYRCADPNYSFNSQRDGILRSSLASLKSVAKFQFPTGWNSTKQKLNEGVPFSSFNSQRDGILQGYSRQI